MSRLDRYIGRNILYGTFVVLIVLIGLFSFFAFIAKLGDIGKGHFGIYQAGKYMLLSTPKEIYELFPMAVLLGTTLGLSSMAVDSELIALRAAGVSALQIMGSVLKVGMIFIVLAVLLGEFVAPTTENWARRDRAAALGAGIQQEDGIWLREGPDFVNILEVLPDLSVRRVTIYRFGPRQHLREQIFARKGVYHRGYWVLTDVHEADFGSRRIRTRVLPSLVWTSVLDPSLLSVFAVNPQSLSVWNLYRYIVHLRHNGQDTRRYELAFWFKVIAPFTTGVMVILAVPFVFGQPRSAGMGLRLFGGVMLGLSFFVINRGFGFFSLLHGLPPVLGATLPTLGFLVLALYLLARTR